MLHNKKKIMLKKLQIIEFNYLRQQNVYFLRQKTSCMIWSRITSEERKKTNRSLKCVITFCCPLYESDHDKKIVDIYKQKPSYS